MIEERRFAAGAFKLNAMDYIRTHFEDASVVHATLALEALSKTQLAIYNLIERRTDLKDAPILCRPVTFREADRHKEAMVLFMEAYAPRDPITRKPYKLKAMPNGLVLMLEQNAEAAPGDTKIEDFLNKKRLIP